MTVVVHPTVADRILADKCPKCGGGLDTGYECNDCGFDCFALATQYEDPFDHAKGGCIGVGDSVLVKVADGHLWRCNHGRCTLPSKCMIAGDCVGGAWL